MRERDESTEGRILEAARSVFLRRGTAGARMQEIADEARVNKALLHYYFRSKERLAAAVFREAAGRLLPAVAELLGSDATLEEKIERFVRLYIATVRESPFIPGYVLAELHQHPDAVVALLSEVAEGEAPRLGRELLGRLESQLREAAESGAIRPIAPVQLIVSVVGLAVMPFLARPLLERALGMDDAAFGRFLDQRAAELPGFILSALRP
jgi:TetR/AcrR family transcriptional regulator